MIRALLRSVGFLLLAACFAAIVVDGTRSIAAGKLEMFAVSETAAWLSPARTSALEAALVARLPAARAALDLILAAPTWLCLGVLGLALLALGRRPAAKIGFVGRP